MGVTRGDRAIRWIEKYCVQPHGPERGQCVRLTPAQRDTVRRFYSDRARQPDISGPLAAYLALLHVCGPEALQRDFVPQVAADIFTTWSATSPELKAVLKRDGDAIVCPQLKTRYPAAA
jgi:hypothetical protein